MSQDVYEVTRKCEKSDDYLKNLNGTSKDLTKRNIVVVGFLKKERDYKRDKIKSVKHEVKIIKKKQNEK